MSIPDRGLQTYFLVNQRRVPSILYGTAWKEDATARCVTDALKAGFRGIDTANQRKHYFEEGIRGPITDFMHHLGEPLFLQTKFTYPRGQDHRLPYSPSADARTQVRQSFESSLLHLGVSHIDSLLLHGPEYGEGLSTTDWVVWRAMEELHSEQRVDFVGISNASAAQLELLVRGAEVRPTFVQNRCYASAGWDEAVRAVCREHGIVYQGFSLLTANRQVWNSTAVAAIAERRARTPAQIVLRFAQHLGILPITGTTDPVHMREDLQGFEFRLSADECETLARLA